MQQFLKNKIGLKSLLVLLFFLAVSLIIYYPTLKSDPIWDDWVFLFKSWPIKNVNPWEYWVWGIHRRSWPVFFTTISLMYKAWGDNTFYYHLTSVVLHACNGFLIYKILKKLNGSHTFLIALLYLVHPLNFFTVAWIIQLKTIMCIFFFLISLGFFLDHLKDGSKYRYWVSVLFFALSLLSKSAFAPVGLMMLFYKDRVKMVPYLLVCLYAVLLTGWTTHIRGLVQDTKVTSYFMSSAVAEENISKIENIVPRTRKLGPLRKRDKDPLNGVALSLNNLTRYSQYVFYPTENLLVQPLTPITYSYKELLTALFVIFIIIFLFFHFHATRQINSTIGLAFFVITLLPLSGALFIPIFNFSNFVEYWLSVPVLGLLLCISMLKTRQTYTSAFLIVAVFFCTYKVSLTAINQNGPMQMIDQAIEASPDNVLIKLILTRHHTFKEQYEESNKILLREKVNSEFRRVMEEDIKENYNLMNNRPYEKSNL
jgi:hypothetical protein